MHRAVALALGLSLAVLAHSEGAHAQSSLADARSRYVQGDFEGTLASVDRAERDETLSVGELLGVLELRALAHRAVGDEAAADRALRTIASIDPAHPLGAEVPPVLRERFTALAAASVGPPRIASELVAGDDGSTVRIAVVVEDDPEGVIRILELRARVDGGDWESGEGGALTVAVTPDAHVEWESRALGPGRAPIASERGEHLVPGEGVSVWPFVAIGLGAALVAVVIGVVVGTMGTGVDTDIEGPIVASLRF